MPLTINELMAGELGRAHGILATSLSIDLANAIAHHLDLPGQLPPGYELQNYVSGFPYADQYVIARISLDPTTERQGMVFSHAFVLDLDGVQCLNDITFLFERLMGKRPKSISARTTTFTITNQPLKAPPPMFCDMLVTQSGGPVVFADPLAFEIAIGRLWPRLLPSLRRNFEFRLSFDPDEPNIDKVHAVTVPIQTLSRWPTDRVIDFESDQHLAETSAGRFLLRDSNWGLTTFLTELDVECDNFNTLSLCCRALELSKSPHDFNSTLVAVRLVGSLQPDSEKGSAIKQTLLHRLGADPGPSTVEQFLALRNLDLSPFDRKAGFLRDNTVRLQSLFESDHDPDALFVLARSVNDPSQSTREWQQAFIDGLSCLSDQAANVLAPRVWRILNSDPELGRFVLRNVQGVSAMDLALSESITYSNTSGLEQLSDTLIDFGFVLTEAQVLIKRHDGNLMAALRNACDRDRLRYGKASINRIIDLLTPAKRVRAAIDIGDPLIVSAAAYAVSIAPSLLSTLSLSIARVQDVWTEALKLNHEAWRISPNMNVVRERVFGELIDHGLSSELLNQLTSTPLKNLLDYSRRAEVWSLLPTQSKTVCLHSTATAWIRSLRDAANVPHYLKPEDELCSAIASPSLRHELELVIPNIEFDHVVNLFTSIPKLPSDLFEQALRSFLSSANDSSTELIREAAQIVADRGWSEITRNIWRTHSNEDKVRDFFVNCADHLNFWDLAKQGIRCPSTDDLYRLLVDACCELYPEGPIVSGIWNRSGGESFKLDNSGSGEQQWHSAVQKIRYGSRLPPAQLLAKMLDDFPRNEQLVYLAARL